MYTSKENIENHLLQDIDPSFNSSIESFINYASSWIENYCGNEQFGKRIFENPTKEVRYFDGNGKREIEIDDAIEIINVKFNYEEVRNTREFEFKAYPLNAPSKGEPYTSIKLKDYYKFEAGLGNIEIEASWGYSEAVPKEVELATTKLVGALLKESNVKNLKEEQKETFDDYSVTYRKINDLAYSLGIDKLLKPYKRKEAKNKVSLGGIKL